MLNLAMNMMKANELLIRLADKYQNIKYKDISVPVPYFINTAEQVYKQVIKSEGIEEKTAKKVFQLIKDGKTPLGSGRGKGSPEEITRSLKRLMRYLAKQGYLPDDPTLIRKWMVVMHIGLDCSGYIYNILNAIEKDQKVKMFKHLAWKDPEKMEPSHAGAFIFDSEELEEINNYNNLKPLDLFVRKDHTHVGILAEYKGNLCLTECSMKNNGITFSRVYTEKDKLTVEGSEFWTKSLKKEEIVIRRINF